MQILEVAIVLQIVFSYIYSIDIFNLSNSYLLRLSLRYPPGNQSPNIEISKYMPLLSFEK